MAVHRFYAVDGHGLNYSNSLLNYHLPATGLSPVAPPYGKTAPLV